MRKFQPFKSIEILIGASVCFPISPRNIFEFVYNAVCLNDSLIRTGVFVTVPLNKRHVAFYIFLFHRHSCKWHHTNHTNTKSTNPNASGGFRKEEMREMGLDSDHSSHTLSFLFYPDIGRRIIHVEFNAIALLLFWFSLALFKRIIIKISMLLLLL